MKKRFYLLILLLFTILSLSTTSVLASDRDKTIVINMNRTNLDYMKEITFLKNELEQRGYIGLMNIRGDGGNDDKRAYATLGSGKRANISVDEIIDFENLTKKNIEQYINTTNIQPKDINLLSINKIINYNLINGQYKATLGSIGQTLSDNDIKVAAIGNADLGTEKEDINRNIGLFAMDNSGRIDFGNIDDINIKDSSMPFSIRTDYNKLIEETKKYYNEADVIFIELGDTHRLDLYKDFLNDSTYSEMKNTINSNIDTYLNQLFDFVDKNDSIYILSAFPSNLDYQEKKRLSPIVKFDGNGKGLLYSSSTKREGIIANVDVGVDLLNSYVLKSDNAVGKPFEYIDNDNNIEFLDNQYEKIIAIANARGNIISTFITLVTFTTIVALLLLLFNNILSDDSFVKLRFIIKEILKIEMILPLSFLISPIYQFKSPGLIITGIIISTIIIYLITYFLFKSNDTKQMLFIAGLTLLIIVIDCIIGTPLMRNSILSYDPIVGARYYGMGNEYQGVVIGTALISFTILLTLQKFPRWIIGVLSIIVLLTTASPSMGANVGASISEFIAFLTLILLLYNIKIDLKKILLIGFGALGVILLFVVIDIVSGSDSHLSLFVRQIIETGPGVIIDTFTRKISMNIKLAGTSMWVNILIASVIIISILAIKSDKPLKLISNKYPLIFKGFIANFIGCIITLLVNDSGIVSAATASLYIIIPILIISYNLSDNSTTEQ